MDLSNHVIVPREDFIELQEVAYNQPTPSLGERAASTAQTTLVFAGIAAALTAGSYGWAKAMDWREERQLRRHMAKRKLDQEIAD